MSKIVAILAIVVVAVAAVTGGVLGYFTDHASSEGNTFATGKMQLLIRDIDEPYIHGTVSESFGGTALMPGAVISGWVKLKNGGSIVGDHIDVEVTNQVIEAGSPPGSEATTPMDTVLQVQRLRYDANGDGDTNDPGEDLLETPPPDSNSNLIVDLDDLENWDQEGPEDLVNLPLNDFDPIEHILELTVRFHPGLGVDQHQGDSVIVALDIHFNQDPSH
jgi:predicted ribosomally synthesized peptide with SipW-like signal peptide